VAAAVPVLGLLRVHEPQVRFVDQGRRLERLTGGLARQLLGSESAQLLIDQREQLAGGVGVALLDGAQDACDLALNLLSLVSL
jgi:hypothetical protein